MHDACVFRVMKPETGKQREVTFKKALAPKTILIQKKKSNLSKDMIICPNNLYNTENIFDLMIEIKSQDTENAAFLRI